MYVSHNSVLVINSDKKDARSVTITPWRLWTYVGLVMGYNTSHTLC